MVNMYAEVDLPTERVCRQGSCSNQGIDQLDSDKANYVYPDALESICNIRPLNKVRWQKKAGQRIWGGSRPRI